MTQNDPHLLDRKHEMPRVWLARRPDEVDDLIVAVGGDVPTVDQHDLVALVQLWVAPEGRDEYHEYFDYFYNY